MSVQSVMLERRCLSLAYKIITEDLGKQVTLVGAFALYLELSKYTDINDLSHRLTTDIDLTTYGSEITQKDYEMFYHLMLKHLGAGYQMELLPAKVRENSVTFKFKVSCGNIVTSAMKIDFNYEGGQKLYDIQPLEVSLARKVSLSASVSDRRVKDKVDVMTIIYYMFRDGVSKGFLLNVLRETGQTLSLSEDWVSDELFKEKVVRSTRRFKPEFPLPNISVLDIVLMTRVLLLGLVKSDVPETALFKGGLWYV